MEESMGFVEDFCPNVNEYSITGEHKRTFLSFYQCLSYFGSYKLLSLFKYVPLDLFTQR